MRIRGSGLLLHLTSLPSPYGIGDMGPEAYKFVDFLAERKQSYWQVLPLNPTDPVFGNTPYNSISAFAGNPLLISPDLLMVEGLLYDEELKPIPSFQADKIDYPAVIAYKDRLLDKAYERFKSKGNNSDYERFAWTNSFWLDDFALFKSIKSQQEGKDWSQWPQGLRDKQKEELQKARDQLKDRIERERFVQYAFFKQWGSLKDRCTSRDIKIIGDIPIYVNNDSAEVWSHPEIFKLDENKRPISVSGVPPDIFSSTGQLWGNPIYNWKTLQEQGFSWWISRLAHNFGLFDILRIDHFRGLIAYWEVDAKENTAVNGSWVQAPYDEFFREIFRHFPYAPIIAEDLGIITPDVREVIQKFQITGMRVLLFAFGEGMDKNPYAPHNHIRNCIVYTGTHDNNTARGWFENEASPEDKQRLSSYLGHEIRADDVSFDLIRLAMMSVADTAILPLQDLLGLGEEARMNHPGNTRGNYQWRLTSDRLGRMDKRLLEMTQIYGRA